mmetsp:Transcript_68392/g.198255  ORF Transcript_68392/g.198255 Transcript_68392/m.198255 type:complete len:310 (+) Transcript_68392:425-1354(+)
MSRRCRDISMHHWTNLWPCPQPRCSGTTASLAMHTQCASDLTLYAMKPRSPPHGSCSDSSLSGSASTVNLNLPFFVTVSRTSDSNASMERIDIARTSLRMRGHARVAGANGCTSCKISASARGLWCGDGGARSSTAIGSSSQCPECCRRRMGGPPRLRLPPKMLFTGETPSESSCCGASTGDRARHAEGSSTASAGGGATAAAPSASCAADGSPPSNKRRNSSSTSGLRASFERCSVVKSSPERHRSSRTPIWAKRLRRFRTLASSRDAGGAAIVLRQRPKHGHRDRPQRREGARKEVRWPTELTDLDL